MSLEDSISALAASNRLLATSNENLAAAFNGYANVLNSISNAGPDRIILNVVPGATEGQAGDLPTSSAAPTAGGKPGRKPKAEAAPAAAKAEPALDLEEPDPFGDVEPEAKKTYTATDVREAILKVRDIGGEGKNKAGALAVMTEIGVKSLGEIKDTQYAKVVELCNKALRSA